MMRKARMKSDLQREPDIACRIMWITTLVFVLATSPHPQQKYSLTFSPEVGDSLLYLLNTSVHVTGKDFTGKEVSLGASAAGEISFSTKRNIQDLVFMGLTTPGIHVRAQTLEGPQSYTLRTSDDMAVQASFDHRGNAHQIHNLAALNRDRIWNISLAQILRDYLPVLPEGPVSVGETWIDKKRLSIPYQGMELDVSIERQYILQNIIPSAQGEEAFISVDYEVMLSGSEEWGEWTASFEGRGEGGGWLNFQVQRSCIREFSAEYQTEASLVLRSEDKLFRKWPFHLKVSASLVMLN
jgi:hypothetical protein